MLVFSMIGEELLVFGEEFRFFYFLLLGSCSLIWICVGDFTMSLSGMSRLLLLLSVGELIRKPGETSTI